MDRGAWQATVHSIAKIRHDCSDLQHHKPLLMRGADRITERSKEGKSLW